MAGVALQHTKMEMFEEVRPIMAQQSARSLIPQVQRENIREGARRKDHSRTFWNILEGSGAFWSSETFWNILEHSGTIWNKERNKEQDETTVSTVMDKSSYRFQPSPSMYDVSSQSSNQPFAQPQRSVGACYARVY
jgi:hypothetical protein